MVVIRLARAGKRKNPFYHLSVTDKRNPRDGRFIERVGYYNPIARGEAVRTWVNLERVDYWISVGAIPSPKVKSIIKNARMEQAISEQEDQVEEATAGEDLRDQEEAAADASVEEVAEEAAEQVEGDVAEAPAEQEEEEPSEESSEESAVEEDTTDSEEIPKENTVEIQKSEDSSGEESKESS
ncbi:MAG: 30S ribosomal protein S16 [Gammaproteobacteria bacterium]|nr:30S ribosomal protein S16 [Gammaproteobacteria bacterium]MYD81706.1 30S ribosomal protein S16 [Gammaproteobacteria bacterium]